MWWPVVLHCRVRPCVRHSSAEELPMRTVLVLLWLSAMSGVVGATAGPAVGTQDVPPEKKGKEAKAETVRGTLQSVDNSEINARTESKASVALQLDSQAKL